MGNEEEMDKRMDNFLEVVHRYIHAPELTPTIANEYIKEIVVYAPDKSSSHRQQKIKIYRSFLDEIEIPEIGGTVVYKRPRKCRERRDLLFTPLSAGTYGKKFLISINP